MRCACRRPHRVRARANFTEQIEGANALELVVRASCGALSAGEEPGSDVGACDNRCGGCLLFLLEILAHRRLLLGARRAHRWLIERLLYEVTCWDPAGIDDDGGIRRRWWTSKLTEFVVREIAGDERDVSSVALVVDVVVRLGLVAFREGVSCTGR